ncbi:MAG: hypothetical protein P4L50_13810 [Anaerolineaceae bacterium]|nr:hypothetical protein [Anaerolineaceae bacterium]
MPETGDTPVGRLRKAVIAQKTAALPDSPGNPFLQPIYDLLYDYDQFTTQTVISVLQGNIGIEDYALRKQIDELASKIDGSSDPMTKRELGLYNNYLSRLDNMMVLVKAVVSDRSIKKE